MIENRAKDLEKLIDDFKHYKNKEIEYQTLRRDIEDKIIELIDPSDTTVRVVCGEHDLVITTKLTTKVDYDELKETLINNSNISEKLIPLFRFGATLKTKEWQEAPSEVKRLLSGAITTKESRPYFKLEEKKNVVS